MYRRWWVDKAWLVTVIRVGRGAARGVAKARTYQGLEPWTTSFRYAKPDENAIEIASLGFMSDPKFIGKPHILRGLRSTN